MCVRDGCARGNADPCAALQRFERLETLRIAGIGSYQWGPDWAPLPCQNFQWFMLRYRLGSSRRDPCSPWRARHTHALWCWQRAYTSAVRVCDFSSLERNRCMNSIGASIKILYLNSGRVDWKRWQEGKASAPPRPGQFRLEPFISCQPPQCSPVADLTCFRLCSARGRPDTLRRSAALGEAVAHEHRSRRRRFRASLLSPTPPGPLAVQLRAAESVGGGALLQGRPGCRSAAAAAQDRRGL